MESSHNLTRSQVSMVPILSNPSCPYRLQGPLASLARCTALRRAENIGRYLPIGHGQEICRVFLTSPLRIAREFEQTPDILQNGQVET